MFDGLSDRIEAIFGRLKGSGTLSEDQVEEVLREVRLALLEADVHTSVVRGFLGKVRERVVGDEIRKSLTPDQHIVKAVNEELIGILGGEHKQITYSSKPPTVIMLAGLQGSGKTTAAGKLALLLSKRGKKPLLVACDLQRPAAVEQLRLVGEQIGVPVVTRTGMTPVDVARESLDVAREQRRDVVIVDTAGRLHVDEEMMAEAAEIKEAVQPNEILFVADAMTGQDAVNVATAFLERVDYTGIILTKLDGDARGGAALSIATVSGRPVKFASVGEQLDSFEPFHPDRMASRILGMGDMLTLIEKADEAYEEEQQEELERKILEQTFTLEDFLETMKGLRKMGPLQSLLGMLPGMRAQMKDVELDERDLGRVEAIIHSMTVEERRDPRILNKSRKLRIARGCGRQPQDVNMLIRQFDQAKVLMQAVAKGGGLPDAQPGMGVQAGPGMAGGGGKPHRARPKQRPKKAKNYGKAKKKKRKKK